MPRFVEALTPELERKEDDGSGEKSTG